jgi:hypothetical protein
LNSSASGTDTIAIGTNAVATNSVAVGNAAQAANGGAAFGDFAVAPDQTPRRRYHCPGKRKLLGAVAMIRKQPRTTPLRSAMMPAHRQLRHCARRPLLRAGRGDGCRRHAMTAVPLHPPSY